jgi:hypothetical protein
VDFQRKARYLPDQVFMNYTEYVGQHSMEFLQKLLTEIITSPKVDIRFEYADDEQWSVTPMWVNDEDQEVALRLYDSGRYALHFGYYDKKDEYFEIIHFLGEAETRMLPKGLQKILHKVLDDEQGMRAPGQLLAV